MTHFNKKGEVTHYNSLKKTCPKNHEYDSVDSRGYRYCHTCKLEQARAAKQRKKEAKQ